MTQVGSLAALCLPEQQCWSGRTGPDQRPVDEDACGAGAMARGRDLSRWLALET
jgi:hypothetical protein